MNRLALSIVVPTTVDPQRLAQEAAILRPEVRRALISSRIPAAMLQSLAVMEQLTSTICPLRQEL